MSTHDAIARYLLGARTDLGPIGLLRLDHSDLSDAAIDYALARELARINRHPQSGDPLAEDARRALHVAAAQLRDPEIRAALLDELAHARVMLTPAAPFAAPMPAASAPQARPMQAEVPPAPRPAANESTVAPQSAPALLPPLDPFEPSTRRASGGPITITLLLASLAMLVGLVVVFMRTAPSTSTPPNGGVSSSLSAAQSPTSAPQDAGGRSGASIVEVPSVPSSLPPAPTDAPKCLALLQQADAQIARDPEHAARVFRLAANWLGEHWPTIEPTLLSGTIEQAAAVAGALARASERAGDLATTTLVELAAPLERRDLSPRAASVAPAVFGAALLGRIARDPTLPGGAASDLRAHIEGTLGEGFPREGAAFENGVEAALRALMPLMLPRNGSSEAPDESRAAWSAWAACARRSAPDEPGVQPLLLDAAERLMIDCSDPAEDPRVHAALEAVLARILWSDAVRVHPRLIAWFDDTRISNDDLADATRAALNAQAPGVTHAMVLQPGAASIDRAITRESFVVAWGLDIREGTREAAERWLRAARASLALADRAATPEEHLVAAARLARLNEAAAWRWAQQPERAGAALDAAEAVAPLDGSSGVPGAPGTRYAPVVPVSPMNVTPSAPPTSPSNGTWAARYLAVPRSPEARLGLLVELRTRGGELDPTDAEVLAEAACFGIPREVRRMAQRVAKEHAESPAMLLGLLEALPRAARQPDVSEMVEELTVRPLPKTSDPSWVFESRRVVIERVLELLLPGAGAPLDRLAQQIDLAYSGQCDALGAWGAAPIDPLGALPAAPEPSSDAATGNAATAAPTLAEEAQADAAESASLLADHWQRQGERLVEGAWAFTTPDRIARRASARMSLTEGPVQRFLSEQVRLLESMAYVVAAERESRAAEVAAQVELAASGRRRAGHVFAQVAACEAALTRLWIIRADEQELQSPVSEAAP